MHIGFIGLGLMGRPLALHLAQAGHTLHLWARRQASLDPFKAVDAKAHASPAEVARHAEIVFTMVADAPDVHAVILGDNGIAAGGPQGLIVVDMSTINPNAARGIGNELAARGIEFLDAPVSGGEMGAINASLTIMVGGKVEVFDKVKPLFEKMGKSITLIGGTGAGQVAKACNQILTGVGVAGRRRGLQLRGAERRRPGPGARGAARRIRLLAHPREPWPAHARPQLQAGLQGLDAPEGPAHRHGGGAPPWPDAASGCSDRANVQRHRRQRHGRG